ncbi:MAG: glycoside hydrolase family 3 N-terminal domain-containing protein [Thermoanaerobaculia bacterium]
MRELTSADREWIDSTLAEMDLAAKAAQLVFVRASGMPRHHGDPETRNLLRLVRDLKVGGVVIFQSERDTVAPLLNRLQRAAAVPLLVAGDFERSLAFRIPRGTVSLPYAMAVGATRSEAAARFTGEVAGREARALGVHWVLAPVVDVNNNPANPVINLRSYGEDPELVARMASAFVQGVHEGGALTSAKHFPGHGNTGVDSHLDLPVLAADRRRLSELEWVPFRSAIDAGVDSVMVAHVAVPAIDPSGAPATLSPELTGQVLRGELGFDGLIATDALEMAGIRPAWTGEAAVRALKAGADVLLLPDDPRVAVSSVVRAVEEGQLDEERIDASVRRLLEAKARVGMHEERLVAERAVDLEVGRPDDVARAVRIAGDAITLGRNEGNVLPLRAEGPLRLLHLELSTQPRDAVAWKPMEDELEARRLPVTTHRLGPDVSPETQRRILDEAGKASHVLVSANVRVSPDAQTPALAAAQARLLQSLLATEIPIVFVSFGSPYVLAELPELDVYLCTFGFTESSQRAAVAALLGEIDVGGKLPVTLPGLYPYGHGLELGRRQMTLAPAPPEAAGFRADAMRGVDAVVQGFVDREAFPGAVLAVGRRGQLVHLQPLGKLSYAADAPAATARTIYDLASLTKVVATTTMAMILVDEGRLDLDKPVRDFLPRFSGEGKEKVTVRHLLTHSSGTDWWAPLYEELEGKAAFLERIQAMPLVYEPGTKSVYSDLGIILLWEILERVAGEELESFVRRRVFEPLGMHDTMYRPPAELRDRIAPTERDPWRGRLVHGEVHDENAYALGGVAPHAGLFGTAGDLARFAQMILNGGVFEHHRIVSRQTVEMFTRPAGAPDSTRALGWDTKSPEGSSAGDLFSPRSFGHTGFTGTSMWIDPDRELFVILLTNRVHPSRENQLIREARPAVADAVVRGLVVP